MIYINYDKSRQRSVYDILRDIIDLRFPMISKLQPNELHAYCFDLSRLVSIGVHQDVIFDFLLWIQKFQNITHIAGLHYTLWNHEHLLNIFGWFN